MKFMGSKRWMLENGLGELFSNVIPKHVRFVDLFTGSGAVARYVASSFEVEVRAVDLQRFSVALAASTVERTSSAHWVDMWHSWMVQASAAVAARKVPKLSFPLKKSSVTEHRLWCEEAFGVITPAYGGHYFSAAQAVWLDALMETMPTPGPLKKIARASLIQAASQCAAAPGHTAQPFSPNGNGLKYIEHAWSRCILERVKRNVEINSAMFARSKGLATVGNALTVAKDLQKNDLVFLDPPYSSVHYSRFYHVLETIAEGKKVEVSGVGRYPLPSHRPKSDFSIKSKAESAISDLLSTIAARDAHVILTFPAQVCSNGLSGDLILDIASKYFDTRKKIISSKLSTLGGTQSISAIGNNRYARKMTDELLIHLKPRC